MKSMYFVLILVSLLAGCGYPIVVDTETCIGQECFVQHCEIYRRDEGQSFCEQNVDQLSVPIRNEAWLTYRGQTASAYVEVDPVQQYAAGGVCLDTLVFKKCAEVDTRDGLGE